MQQYNRPGESNILDGPPMENPIVLGSGAGCLVCTAIFAAFSLGAVPPLHYGIMYNVFNKQANIDDTKGPGRYFILPWNTFLLFPADVQTIEFTGEPRLEASGLRFPALHTRTKEGLALHLQVSLQYQLDADKVGYLYREFNKNYEQMFTSTIRDTLIRAASQYEAFQLWEERENVGIRMQEMVGAALNRTYATCWGLQLMVIELPNLFESSIVKTQVQKQKVATRRYEQEATRVRAVTSVIAAEFDKKVTVIKAGGKANYTLATKEAQARARSRTLNVEGNILKGIKDNLRLSPQELIRYQQFSSLQALENASLYYGFQDNTQILITARQSVATAATSSDMVDGVPLGGVQIDSTGAVPTRTRNLKDESHPSDEL